MASVKLFIGSLSWNTTDESLRDCFATFGEVLDSTVIRDRETGRSRGFGFVTYGSDDDAERAIQSMNGQDLDGRSIKVDRATERAPNSGGGRGGYGGGRGGRGGFGGGNRSYGGDRGAPRSGGDRW